jgi:PAS domain-containing protein
MATRSNAPDPPGRPAAVGIAGWPEPVAALLRVVWPSPFAATLQDGSFRLVDVNEAFLALVGQSRETLIGVDPVALQPAEDREGSLAIRRRHPASAA